MLDELTIEDITLPVGLYRSSRKTLSISVTDGGELSVKAPIHMPDKEIERFIEGKRFWIYKQAKRIEMDNEKRVVYSEAEEKMLREKARKILTQKTDYYKQLLSVDYDKIRIGDQRTRWGSCSSRRTISYSWRLILMPEAIQDYVVVHELSHLLEMNHSKKFWMHVEKVIPDYKSRRLWLKKHGGEYM